MGDPTEIAALTRAFREGTERRGFCALGSVKTNVGHLGAAAGMAGLIKTVLALENREIPPSLLFEEPNPQIDFAGSPFYVNTELLPWPAGVAPRRAGVSAFGMGGTNAHVVLEEAPSPASPSPSRPWQLLLLSARTPTALEEATVRLAGHLAATEDLALADAAYTLQMGRKAFEHRRALPCQERAEASAALAARDPRRVRTALTITTERPVAFLFPGQGAQYAGMTAGLYAAEAVFRSAVDRCCELLAPHMDLDLRALLYPSPGRAEESARQLDRTANTQPALFVVAYALARLLGRWGVRPAAMLGHSIGEYVAACLAGVFRLEDALALVATRGRLMQGLPPGAMLAVSLPELEIEPMLDRELALAAVNGPSRCVVSGPEERVAELAGLLAGRGVDCRRLRTSHAFHSPMVEPILGAFAQAVESIDLEPPRIPFLSNVTGAWIQPAEAMDRGYWVRHLRSTVRFDAGLRALLAEPDRVLLEVGTGHALAGLARRHPDRAVDQPVLSSLPPRGGQLPEQAHLLDTLGQLWLAGVTVDWQGFSAGESRRRIPLPTYPFEGQRYWLATGDSTPVPKAAAARRRQEMADWFYLPYWKPSLPPSRSGTPEEEESAGWLILADRCGLGEAIAERLAAAGLAVTTVFLGERLRRLDSGRWEVAAASREELATLWRELGGAGRRPGFVLHLWGITAGVSPSPAELLEQGFYSLLALAQALGDAGDDAVRLAVVADGMQGMDRELVPYPEKAAVIGPCRVIPQEYPHLSTVAVDVLLPAAGTAAHGELCERLIAETRRAGAGELVAYRAGARYVQAFEPVRVESPAGDDVRLRRGGVYLITGGLGGFGLTFAEYLAREHAAKLVLVGRSALPERESFETWLATHGDAGPLARKLGKLLELEALGAEVMVASADVADPVQLAAVVREARRRFGAIHGVIHAAGVPGGGLIQLKDPRAAAQVIAPKVQGTRALVAAVSGEPLDFLLLCSSTIALLGGLGQVDYCAANSVLDAFAHSSLGTSARHVVAVNWGGWQEVGMAAETPLPASLGGSRAAVAAAAPIHPLLERCIEWRPDRQVYATDLSVDRHWVVAEHRILGVGTVPGTTYLEMARAAFERAAGAGPIEIEDLVFPMPLRVRDDERREIRLALVGGGGASSREFTVRSRSASESSGWQEHAQGRIGRAPGGASERLDLAELLGRCREREERITGPVMTGEAGPVSWGPRWQSLRAVHVGDGEGVAELELPADYRSELTELPLHPALLDVATAVGTGLIAEGRFLPLSYRKVRVVRPLSARLFSHVRQNATGSRETASFDVVLFDEGGEVAVEIEGFVMKRFGESAAQLDRANGERAAGVFVGLAGDGGPRAERPAPGLFAKDGMLPAQGVEVLRRVLSLCGPPQVVASPKDLDALLRQARVVSRSVLLDRMGEIVPVRQAHPRPSLPTPYVEPSNAAESRLTEVWQGVLGVDQIGIHDNFFELGGDSVLGMHVVTRAGRAGLRLTPDQLFAHQTIAELAAVAGGPETASARPDELGTGVVATVSLTPYQRRILAGDVAERLIWAGVRLGREAKATPERLASVLAEILARHDALRLRAGQDGAELLAVEAAPLVPMATLALAGLAEPERIEAMRQAALRLCHQIDPARGVLLAALAVTGDSDLVVWLAVHRLAADPVALELLADDLRLVDETSDSAERPCPLAFRMWPEHLARHAAGNALVAEVDLWLDLWPPRGGGTPVDGSPAPATAVRPWALDDEETRFLLGKDTGAHGLGVEAVLLGALAAAWGETGADRPLCVEVERDGRAQSPWDLDFSRTIGCFTFTFTFALPVPPASAGGAPEAAILAVRELLRALPAGGLGYGLLGAGAGGPEVAGKLSERKVDLVFRYLGEVRHPVAEAWWEAERFAPGGAIGEAAEIEVTVQGGRLHFTCDRRQSRLPLDRLVGLCREKVRAAIAGWREAGETPSWAADFPEAGLSGEELEQMLAKLGRSV